MTQTHKSFSFFMVVWTGQLLSRIGNGITAFSLGVYLFQKTGSTTTYSMLLLCAFLPSVLLTPVGIIQSISGTGMIISSLLIGLLSKTADQRKLLFFSLLATSLFYILIGTSTSIVLITIYTFCLFSCLPL